MPNIKELIDAIRKTVEAINFEPQEPKISKKNSNSFENIGLTDKLVLLSAIGITDYDKDEIDSILDKRVEDYSINYSTGDVEIKYKTPIEYVTMTIDINEGK